MKNLTHSNLSNKQLIESALKHIEKETGLHIKDKTYGNTYFVIEDDVNTICNFHIKEIPGFIFSFWNTKRFDSIQYQIEKRGIGNTWADSLRISPKSELVFFTQYERDVDKFKPSASSFVTGIFREVYYEGETGKKPKRVESWNMYDLEHILLFMKQHPVKAYHYVQSNIDYVWGEISGFTALKYFCEDWFQDKKHKIKTKLKHKITLDAAKQLVDTLKFSDCVIIDDENCYPRLTINIRHKSKITKQEYESDNSLIECFYDKWFNKITVQQWEMNMSVDLSKDDIREDKELGKKFNKMLKTCSKKIVYSNIKK